MSGQDLRKIMNLMESVDETIEVTETEELNEGVVGMDTEAVLWQLFEYGVNFGKTFQDQYENKGSRIIQEMIAAIGPTVGKLGEEAVMETGNANAQQKGINFSGTPATKNKGDMDLSSPKSKAAGSKTPLAQAKSGTNVGKIKS